MGDGVSHSATANTAETAPNGWSWGLLRGFRGGEPDALRSVYQMYVEEVGKQLRYGFTFESRGRAHRFVGYGGAFEFHDALHETFRRAFEPRAREGYDGLRPYGPYLRAIARNVVLKSFRAREVLFPPVGDDEGEAGIGALKDEIGPSPEQAVMREQIRGVVKRFLDTLPPEDRALCKVRFVDGKSQRDAAEILGLGRQQVRGRESKLRARLVEYLRAQGETGLMPASMVWLVVVHSMTEVLR
jgi:RNA polymerase sigma factor (sigma-70 family)